MIEEGWSLLDRPGSKKVIDLMVEVWPVRVVSKRGESVDMSCRRIVWSADADN